MKSDKLTTKRMRQIAGFDNRAGAPVGNALERAADHIDMLIDALKRIEKQASRCRGEKSHRDAIAFIIKAAAAHRQLPVDQSSEPYSPEGWVLMPVTATDDMLDSMQCALYSGEEGQIGFNPKMAYSELIERAPLCGLERGRT